MSATFANSLRVRPAELRLAPAGTTPTIGVRVEMPEVWDVVRVVATPGDSIVELKIKALDALFPSAEIHQDFVVKLRGWEILDESVSLAEAGVVDGTVLLVTHRRRRAVR